MLECQPCAVLWGNGPRCWVCGRPGTTTKRLLMPCATTYVNGEPV